MISDCLNWKGNDDSVDAVLSVIEINRGHIHSKILTVL